ncbi:MAG: YadA C-terminal domain-containing protein [Cellvibrionales bacterium]|nr:YadA C-terminal domain-containing protein [Cellvibrionales bacterium]
MHTSSYPLATPAPLARPAVLGVAALLATALMLLAPPASAQTAARTVTTFPEAVTAVQEVETKVDANAAAIGASGDAADDDGSVHARINAEKAARETAIGTAGTQDATSKERTGGTGIHGARDTVTNEIRTDFTDADTQLGRRITANDDKIGASGDTADDDGSVHARINAVKATADDNEDAIGASGDTADDDGSVHARINAVKATADDNEDAIGASGDTADDDGSVHARINAEKAARESADSGLSDRIDALTSTSSGATGDLGRRIDSETTDRTNADARIEREYKAEDVAIRGEISDVSDAIEAETDAREAALGTRGTEDSSTKQRTGGSDAATTVYGYIDKTNNDIRTDLGTAIDDETTARETAIGTAGTQDDTTKQRTGGTGIHAARDTVTNEIRTDFETADTAIRNSIGARATTVDSDGQRTLISDDSTVYGYIDQTNNDIRTDFTEADTEERTARIREDRAIRTAIGTRGTQDATTKQRTGSSNPTTTVYGYIDQTNNEIRTDFEAADTAERNARIAAIGTRAAEVNTAEGEARTVATEDSVYGYIDSTHNALNARITQEQQASIARDDALGVRIDNERTASITRDNAERTARINADNAIHSRIDTLSRDAFQGIAMAMAMQSPGVPPGRRGAFTVGLGHYAGEQAVALSLGVRPATAEDNISFSASLAAPAHRRADSSEKIGARVSFTYEW